MLAEQLRQGHRAVGTRELVVLRHHTARRQGAAATVSVSRRSSASCPSSRSRAAVLGRLTGKRHSHRTVVLRVITCRPSGAPDIIAPHPHTQNGAPLRRSPR
ncbi:MAG: hypothetical protein ABS81_15835 [Pseudonocardia sp. SCN 72-86]|nr:MAG: hypothetical protein ABS81_15835 [Pseudonocardia sp. SCN 72-86]